MPVPVVGLDLGGSRAIVAKVENGGVVVLANEISHRSTPAVVTFPVANPDQRGAQGFQRLFGASAESQLVTSPRSTVCELRNLLDLNDDGGDGGGSISAEVHRERSKLRLASGSGGQRLSSSTTTFDLIVEGSGSALTPQQVVAAFLAHVDRTFLQGQEEAHYVLSVPQYFGHAERAALLDAAAIAGIRVVALAEDLTAAALAYGYFQKDWWQTDENNQVREKLVVFICFGYTSLQASLVKFTPEGFETLGKASDRTLGGSQIDRRLAAFFASRFSERHRDIPLQVVPRPPPNNENAAKAHARLLAAAEKAKKSGSAFASAEQKVPVDVECLYRDRDLKTQTSRLEMEELCGDLFGRVRSCLSDLIMVTGLDPAKLSAVEVIGGSSRLPKFKDIVREIFEWPLEISLTTLNADEAVAKGCALLCASLTKVYRVRPFRAVDWMAPARPSLKLCLEFSHLVTEDEEAKRKDSNTGAKKAEPAAPRGTTSKTVALMALPAPPGTLCQPQKLERLPIVFRDREVPEARVTLDSLPLGGRVELKYSGEQASVEQGVLAIATYELDLKKLQKLRGCEFYVVLSFRMVSGIVSMSKAVAFTYVATAKGHEGKTEFDEMEVGFVEVGRPGLMSAEELERCSEAERQMRARDRQEESRHEAKNSLEELVYRFKEEMSDFEGRPELVEVVQVSVTAIEKLQGLINGDGGSEQQHQEQQPSERYESWTEQKYRHELKELQALNSAFKAWRGAAASGQQHQRRSALGK